MGRSVFLDGNGACYRAPRIVSASSVVCGAGCTRLDLDRDDDIDLSDYVFIADLLEPPAP